MFRIEKNPDECVTTLRLSGRLQADHIGCIRLAMDGGCARKVLDLTSITLVDRAVIRFLIGCENEGVELAHCPPYMREWINRERDAEAHGG